MKITLPSEVVEEVLINELSSLLQELKEKLQTLKINEHADLPVYSSNPEEEYAETVKDYEACKHILTYYGGTKCVANII